MRRKLRLVAILSLLALITSAPALAKKTVVVVVPVIGTPQWQAVPQVTGVQYAPNLGYDLFRYQHNFYYWCQGQWFLGRSQTGPWQPVTTLPPVFYQVQAPYFKSPPGWAKGKKTGWRGQPLPPGQMKKLEGGGPPGQMKKMQ